MNFAGGLKIAEPAADLAAAAALASSHLSVAVPLDTVVFGEISLSGGVRAVSHANMRLKEAQKLGFKSAILPASGDVEQKRGSIALKRLDRLQQLVEHFAREA